MMKHANARTVQLIVKLVIMLFHINVLVVEINIYYLAAIVLQDRLIDMGSILMVFHHPNC